MKNITDKADSTAGATGQLPAAEYNDHKNELQGAVTRSGQSLSAGILLQLARALFINGAGANSVVDSSSLNTVILSPVTGSSGLHVPDNYSELDGAILQFDKTTANTSTSVTVNFGQTGTELGAKTLVRSDGSVPAIGDVIGICLIRWDNGNDRWVLLVNGADTYKYNASDTDTIDPKFENNNISIDVTGGNATITLGSPVFVGQRVSCVANGSGIADITIGGGVPDDTRFTATEGLNFIAVDKAGTLEWSLNVNPLTTAKAWVNFDGTGVVAIRDSFNVSSITDNGVGDYTVNFTNAMNDANYTWTGNVLMTSSTSAANVPSLGMRDTGSAPTVSGFLVKVVQAGALLDLPYIMIQVFGQ